jgi:hypothetical protein
MTYEVQSDRQACGNCSGEVHKVVRIDTREVVTQERRRDIAEQVAAWFNRNAAQRRGRDG